MRDALFEPGTSAPVDHTSMQFITCSTEEIRFKIYIRMGVRHRRRIKTEAKVVACSSREKFNTFLAALAVLPRKILIIK